MVAVGPEKTAILGLARAMMISPMRSPKPGQAELGVIGVLKLDLLQFVGNLLRAVALPVLAGCGFVTSLEKTAGLLGAHDNSDRARFPALFSVNLIRRNQIDFASSNPDLDRPADFGVIRLRAIVEALITLDRFIAVENAV